MKTLEDAILKPAMWQYDDYQKAKQTIYNDLCSLLPEAHPYIRFGNDLNDQETGALMGFDDAIELMQEALARYCGQGGGDEL